MNVAEYMGQAICEIELLVSTLPLIPCTLARLLVIVRMSDVHVENGPATNVRQTGKRGPKRPRPSSRDLSAFSVSHQYSSFIIVP